MALEPGIVLVVRALSKPSPAAAFGLTLVATLGGCTGEVLSRSGYYDRDTVRESPRIPGPTNPGTNPGTGTPTPDPVDPNPDPNPGIPTPSSACEAIEGPNAVEAPLRRITRSQFENIIQDLFAGRVTVPAGFPAPFDGLGQTGYSTEPAVNITSNGGAQGIMEVAESVAIELTQGPLREVLPCAAQNAGRACAQTYLDTIVARAFRRPLTADERSNLLGVFDAVASSGSFGDAIAVVTQVALQSPQFLFIAEPGSGPSSGRVALTPYELAARLSFFLWDSIPDAQLLALAESGALADTATLEREATRMLQHPNAARALGRFAKEWLHLREFEPADKDPQVYPSFTQSLADAMEEEVRRWTVHAFQSGRTLGHLINSRETFVNQELASLYGLQGLSFDSPDGWVAATLAENERTGILTRAAPLATHAHLRDSSYIRRGYLVRTQFFCDVFGAPPADAIARQPQYPPNASGRERSQILRGVTQCAGCHDLMDPVGLAFENFDAIGAFRSTMPNGQPIQTADEVAGGGDAGGPIQGPFDFSDTLAMSQTVQKCFVRQVMRFAFGRLDRGDADKCAVERIESRFASSGGRLDELVTAFVTSEAFRYRQEN